MPESSIKECFGSRFVDGYIVNADFSQLEVVYAAHASGDRQLLDDILSGKDLHTMRAAELFNIPEGDVTKQQRQTAKSFAFALQYGSGAKSMAEEQGVPINVAKKFILSYYKRYPDLKMWQEKVAKEVMDSSTPSTRYTTKRYPARMGEYRSETGRTYRFYEHDAPEFMVKGGTYTSFSPTEMKNYPMQGGATGDIVPMMVARINRWLHQLKARYKKVKLINTVHDSIMLDVSEEYVYHVCVGVKKILEDTGSVYKQTFGVEFSCPLKVDVTFGKTWADQKFSVIEENGDYFIRNAFEETSIKLSPSEYAGTL